MRPTILPTGFLIWGASGGGQQSFAERERSVAFRPVERTEDPEPNGIYAYDGSDWIFKPGSGSDTTSPSEGYNAVTIVDDPLVTSPQKQNILGGSDASLYLSGDDGDHWRKVDAIRCSEGLWVTSLDVQAFLGTTDPDGVLMAAVSQSPTPPAGERTAEGFTGATREDTPGSTSRAISRSRQRSTSRRGTTTRDLLRRLLGRRSRIDGVHDLHR